jgi:hypothetical protein
MVQGVSNMLWALARLEARPSSRWLAAFIAATAGRLGQGSTQSLANCCWALARLHRLEEATPAAAAAGHLPDSPSQPPGSSLHQGAPPAAGVSIWLLVRRSGWLQALVAASYSRLPSAEPQHLATLLWSLAALGAPPPEPWADAWLAASYSQLPAMRPQELSSCLAAAVALRLRVPPAWAQRLVACLVSQAGAGGGVQARHVAQAMWGLAARGGRMDLDQPRPASPDQSRRTSAHSAGAGQGVRGAGTRAGRADSHQQALPGAAAAAPLSLLALPPPPAAQQQQQQQQQQGPTLRQHLLDSLAQCCAAHLVASSAVPAAPAGLPAYTQRDLAAIAWAAAQRRVQLPEGVWRRLSEALCDERLGEGASSPQALAMVLWAFAAAGQQPAAGGLPAAAVVERALAAAAGQLLPSFSLQGLCMVLWAVARLGCSPQPQLLMPLVERAGQLLTSSSASAAAGATPSGGTAGSANSSTLSPAGSSASTRSDSNTAAISSGDAGAAGGQAAATILYALAALGFYPGSTWMRSYQAAAAPHLGTYSARELAQVLSALALLGERPAGAFMASWEGAWAAARAANLVGAREAAVVRRARARLAGGAAEEGDA